jgi:hypothetical protein
MIKEDFLAISMDLEETQAQITSLQLHQEEARSILQSLEQTLIVENAESVAKLKKDRDYLELMEEVAVQLKAEIALWRQKIQAVTDHRSEHSSRVLYHATL